MSCPDWNDLTDHRRSGAAEPNGWSEAMAHLDRCGACRDQASAADPTLIFRRLPPVETGADEIAAMRAGVAALRRAGRVAEPLHATFGAGALGSRIAGTRWSARWGRAAAAAVLVAGLLSVQPALEHRAADRLGAVPADGLGTVSDETLSIALLEDSDAAAVDDILSPYASVYHLDEEEFGLVMVVDPDLDV